MVFQTFVVESNLLAKCNVKHELNTVVLFTCYNMQPQMPRLSQDGVCTVEDVNVLSLQNSISR